MIQTARVFQSGNSQAVRLPKDFRFEVDEVEISREGDALILRPIEKKPEAWQSLRRALERGVSQDFNREQPVPQERDALTQIFD